MFKIRLKNFHGKEFPVINFAQLVTSVMCQTQWIRLAGGGPIYIAAVRPNPYKII
jgi:hypothetical protein